MRWLALATVALSACTSGTPIGMGNIPDELARTARVSNLPIGDYRIAPGDVLEFRMIGGDPSLDTVQTVRLDGRISLPYIDDPIVGGLTMQEARQRLTEAYVKKGILKPNIALQTKGA